MQNRARHLISSTLVRTSGLVLGLFLHASALGAGVGPVLGGSLPAPLPLFPADNWWNTDITAAPVDTGSAGYVSFINNGGTRKLHPDLGGDVSTGSVQTYGMPYAV